MKTIYKALIGLCILLTTVFLIVGNVAAIKTFYGGIIATQQADKYTYQFDYTTDLTNISYRHWDFGDGTGSSLQRPTHTYTTNGVKEVTLVLINGSKTRNYYAEVTPGS